MSWISLKKNKKIDELESELEFWQKAAEDAIQSSRVSTSVSMKTVDWNVQLIDQKREFLRFVELLLEDNMIPKDSKYYGMALDLAARYGERESF